MKKYLFIALALCGISCSGNNPEEAPAASKITIDKVQIEAEKESSEHIITVTADSDWGVSSSAKDWCTVSPTGGAKGTSTVKVTLAENKGAEDRTATVKFKTASTSVDLNITQKGVGENGSGNPDVVTDIKVPAGYKLVWHDEFDYTDRDVPSLENWRAEVKDKGWVNNELQYYVSWRYDGYNLSEVSNGTMKLTAQKFSDGKVRSIRMYSNASWKYGYMEARLKLPKGRGTWPAFWMMPQNFKSWPADGEIDIMEHVGYHQDYVSSSIHCTAYNHPNHTQKTHEFYQANSCTEFHTYAVEWTADKMDFIFDGKVHFTFKNDGKGNKDTWPFNEPFYIILNLAWGGDWGGAQGVDEGFLPATMEVDYVRVFQKQ